MRPRLAVPLLDARRAAQPFGQEPHAPAHVVDLVFGELGEGARHRPVVRLEQSVEPLLDLVPDAIFGAARARASAPRRARAHARGRARRPGPPRAERAPSARARRRSRRARDGCRSPVAEARSSEPRSSCTFSLASRWSSSEPPLSSVRSRPPPCGVMNSRKSSRRADSSGRVKPWPRRRLPSSTRARRSQREELVEHVVERAFAARSNRRRRKRSPREAANDRRSPPRARLARRRSLAASRLRSPRDEAPTRSRRGRRAWRHSARFSPRD